MAGQVSGGDRLFRSIQAAKPKLVTGVPDGMLAQTSVAAVPGELGIQVNRMPDFVDMIAVAS